MEYSNNEVKSELAKIASVTAVSTGSSLYYFYKSNNNWHVANSLEAKLKNSSSMADIKSYGEYKLNTGIDFGLALTLATVAVYTSFKGFYKSMNL
jgi:hypothetical protein